ncbi:diguanylate cyclase [Thermoclostridium stercorarium subsp. leptospartum DSM 9219]|jgi:oligopeptide transport system permease protein|uniref:Diguanylate cyclase n=1 Tax=Thermoclostridium stercorarium subsp. leptospartum DSM 9219 TaxID=1346611 RepID=A0A1B1YH87_THEST|nr:ABC transporter permease [Thermoclostridium stercorarium]ANX00135.1 diguanylate cyclase [Thermoclostridium stercorarium subsp. leptospartum DSM 9219]
MSNNISVNLPEDAFIHIDTTQRQSEIITRPGITFWADARRRLFRNRVAMTGLAVIVIITLLAIFVPIFSEYAYDKQDLSNTNAPPSLKHPFGTDSHGRDLWVRVWVGARVSLAVGIFGSIIPGIIGVIIGGISGYFGGKVDMIIMRFIDIVMCVPNMIYIILITIYIGTGPVAMVIAFALTGWMGIARNVRGMILQLKEQEFVLASRALGASPARLIFQHLIPNTLGIVVVSMTMGVPSAIFQEAFLSFIGLGISPPIPSWGQLANLGISVFRIYPYQLLIPAALISVTMLSFNLFGDGLRDALDPKLRM